MSDGISIEAAVRQQRRDKKLGRVANGGLSSAISRAGGQLLGFSVKLDGEDVLLTLRVRMPAGRRIAYFGADTVASALIKAFNKAQRDEIKWKPDRYAR